jgi:hypothetical protein
VSFKTPIFNFWERCCVYRNIINIIYHSHLHNGMQENMRNIPWARSSGIASVILVWTVSWQKICLPSYSGMSIQMNRIWGPSGSNVGLEKVYSDWGLPWLSTHPRGKRRGSAINCPMTASFHTFPNSPFVIILPFYVIGLLLMLL